MAEATTAPKNKDTVKVRVLRGRLLLERGASEDKFAQAGDIIELSRTEAEKLAKRAIDGYPMDNGSPAQFPSLTADPIVEILAA